MAYHEEWAAIEARLKSIQPVQPAVDYIRDGVVSLELWRRQQIRPLFIGKEAYGKNGWSIANELANRPSDFCRKSPRSWRKTSYISYALQNRIVNYSEIYPIRNSQKVAEALRTIAFINVGKIAGGKVTPGPRLAELYRQNRTLLHEQIALCQPNIIIGWNTLSYFEKDSDFLKKIGLPSGPRQSLGSVDYWFAGSKLFIDTYHPASFKIKQQQYVGDILQVVKINQNALNLDLPTGNL